MKKDVVMYRNGSFVDFQGVNHSFIVCALSTSAFNSDCNAVELTTYEDDYIVGDLELPRAVFVGISVCNPIDKNDEEHGKMIAYNRAKGFKYDAPEKSAAIFATRAGMISEGLVNALLDREVQHVIDDPECVIKGYNQMKKRWEEAQERKKFLEEVPENIKNLGTELAKMSEEDMLKVINVALIKSNE